MKNLLVTLFACATLSYTHAAENKTIRISTDNTDLVLQVGDNGRLYQTYLGERLLHEQDLNNFSWSIHAGADGSVSRRGWEVYSGSGNEDYFEPAIAITHNDGNPSTILYYVSSSSKAVEGGMETVINLRDDKYPVDVTLHYVAYPKENVIKTWSEIIHQEKKPVMLSTYASTMLYFNNSAYYLTEFSSDWAKEAQMSSQQLQFGKKVIDTKLGSRAAMHTHPFFEVGLDQPVREDQGSVLMGTLGWIGNFRFIFEVDNVGNLRVIPGINPYASNYELKPNEVFTTPEFIFTLSNDGAGKGSRNLHEWARNYSLKDGKGSRLTLLNNWENTGFNFNQEILTELMKEAKHLGVDMFLLDDGWFANKYPRKNDHAGLGDWDVNHNKLPGGIPALVKAAKDADVKFGIWIEPEMVSEDSDLYREHPDWAITIPGRKPVRSRNQLVLDFSRKEVRDEIFKRICAVLDQGNVEYIKWDMNRYMSEPFSRGASAADQGKTMHKYILGVYELYTRLTERFPDILFESCASGGARFDPGMLYFAPQTWTSDDTDAAEREKIQYGTSFVYPIVSMGSHVSAVPNHQLHRTTPLSTRANVAYFGTFGYELDLNLLSDEEIEEVKAQVEFMKEHRDLIQVEGDFYRILSPFEGNDTAWMVVSRDKKQAVAGYYERLNKVNASWMRLRFKGLDEDQLYKVKWEDKCLKAYGNELMYAGIPVDRDYCNKTNGDFHSVLYTIEAED